MPTPTHTFNKGATIIAQVNSLVEFAAELAAERTVDGAAMFWELLLERVTEKTREVQDRRWRAKRRRAVSPEQERPT